MKRLAQGERILALLRALGGCASGAEVPLPAILALSPRIAQHTARITELRHAGYDIRCRSEWVNGDRHTFYRLVANKGNRASLSQTRDDALEPAGASRASTAGAGPNPPSPPSPRAGATPAPAILLSPAARREQPDSPQSSARGAVVRLPLTMPSDSRGTERRQAVRGTAAGDSLQLELRLC
jgi:hypothetical protein